MQSDLYHYGVYTELTLRCPTRSGVSDCDSQSLLCGVGRIRKCLYSKMMVNRQMPRSFIKRAVLLQVSGLHFQIVRLEVVVTCSHVTSHVSSMAHYIVRGSSA